MTSYKISNKFKSFVFKISDSTRWSNLAALGNLSIMKLVILVPFIGSMIIFNEYFVNLFSMSSVVLQDLGVSVDTESAKAFTLYNLYYFYFGLLSLGLGSLLFSIFCPKEVRATSNEDEYARNYDNKSSQVTTRNNLQRLLSLEHKTEKYYKRSRKLDQQFHNLILEIYRRTEKECPDFSGSFINGAGYPDIEAISQVVSNDVKVSWVFTKPFQDASVNFSGDILRCLYALLELTFPIVRVIIACFYLIGLALLFIPTAKTIFKILTSTF